MNFIDGVFFFYIFIGLYMTSLFIFIYLMNKKSLFSNLKGKAECVSIVMPCYNEAEYIGEAIESLLNLDYPKNKFEIIIVDDKSTDNSVEIIEKYVQKYKNVRLIKHEVNSGCAAASTNTGIRNARYDYIAVADADSTPDKDSLIKMIKYLQDDSKTGAVTCQILSKNPHTLWQKLQNIEYVVIAFSRKLLDCVDSVYVTPGPFALYRKNELIKLGFFDEKNLTQDIEITWRYVFNGYHARMCLDTSVHSYTPEKFKDWWKQRIRWNIGGLQTLSKYYSFIFRKGMLGAFIIPLFAATLFLGLFGFGILLYLFTRRIIITYLSTSLSIYANTAILTMEEISFTPSVLNFFGFILFITGIIYSLLGLYKLRERRFGRIGFFSVLLYTLVYLSIYPLILLTSVYKFLLGRYSW
jgi:biofilm PGA synthesis N-glycosyltransferase PgaC